MLSLARRAALLILALSANLVVAPITSAAGPPVAPTGLAAVAGDGTVSLAWDPNGEPDIAGYRVYRDGGPGGTPATLVGTGDIAVCGSGGDEATAALIATIPGTVFTTGDNVYDNGTAAEFANCYAPSWGQPSIKNRTRPAPGNHDYNTTNAAPYYAYFGAAAGDPTKGYYSYDLGAWHVIVLNSNCGIVPCNAGSVQEQWLRGDLAATSARCVVAMWHHPRFSSSTTHGNSTTVQALYQALYDFNADLILTGHVHNYERFGPQTATGIADANRGIRQFVIGTGGRSHYAFGTLQPNSEAQSTGTYGVLKLGLYATSYNWEFVPVAGGVYSDTGSTACHDANGPLPLATAPLNSSLLTSPQFVDTTAANGVTYDYAVTAVNTAGEESPLSGQVTATPSGGPGSGSALDFDGSNDHVTLGTGTALRSNTFTVETWLRRDGAGVTTITSGSAGGVTAEPLVTKGRSEGGQTTNWFLGIQPDGRLAGDYESVSDDANHGIVGTTVLANGTWYHAALTYDGTALRLYLNGAEQATVADSDGPGTAANQPPAIGTSIDTTGATGGFFNGVLDEVRVWNVARTGAQLLASRDQELTSGTGLVARYGLNEGAGTSVASSVAGAPTGTAVGGPLWVPGAPFGGGNVAPVFSTEFTDRSDAEGAVISFDANASDANPGDTLTYSATNLPSGISINSSTGVVSGTLSGTSSGSYAVVLTVSDGSLTDTDSFTWTVTEPGSGSALDFDGSDDHVTFGAATSSLGLTNFTIETWFRRDGAGSTTSTGSGGVTAAIPLVTKGRTENDTPANINANWFLGIDSVTGVLVADFEDNATGTNHPVTGITAIPIGPIWHHAAVTYNTATDTWNLYLDGVLERNLPAGGDFTPQSLSIQHAALGTAINSTGVTAGFFSGVLDEVRIWNVARTGAQILASKDQELTSGTGLVARYGLSEGSGGSVASSVAGAPTGTGVGGPLWVPGAPFAGGANVAPVFSTEFTDRTDPEGAVISFDANASDANPGDTLTYSATNLPNGITINASTGVVSGTLSGTSSGSYNVVLTVSDGSLTDTDSFTWTVTEPAGPTVYAEDQFGRTVVNHWNSATTGGSYTLLSTAADYDVNGAAGTISIPTAGNTRSAILTSVSAQDIDLSFSVATNKLAVGGHQYVYGIARRVSATAEYRIKVRLATTGQVFVQATSVSGGVETGLNTEVAVPGLTHTANGIIRVRAQVAGTSPTTIRIRAWADGSPEPATWNYTVTNGVAELQASGGVGLRTYIGGTTSNAPVLVTFDNFLVTSLGGPPVNSAPVFSTEFTDRTDAEGAVISFDANASDANPGDTLTYSATNLPNGILINASTGVVSGTLSGTSSGSYAVVLTVSDGTLTDTDSFTWTVTEPAVNVAPVFSTEFTDRTDAEGALISFDANASDANPGDTLTYSATNLPNGITINAGTGVVSGTLSATSSGSHAVVLTVSDGTLTDTDSFTWTVTEPAANVAPVFSTEFTDRTDAEGAVISFDANASDANPGDTLTYSATNLPNGISINAGTGVVSGTLSGTSSGSYAVVLTVSDGTLSDTDSFTWTVTEPAVNVAPVFSTEFTDRTDPEGAVISFDANATDANPGDTLTYSATNLPNGILINSSTGVVSGTLSATSSGSYAVVLTVSDGTLTDTDSFTWTVTEPAANVAPVFSTEFTDRTDAEGALISFDANASDANPGDTLTYSATNLPNGITINAGTGVVSGTLSATSSGSYNVVLTVSDGTLTDTDSFTWTVTEPAANVAPVFSTEFTDRTDAEGALISFDANASDANPGDTLTYSATNLPNGITINAGTGVVSGTLSATSSGSYNVVLTVSDGTLTDTDSFTWTVTEPAGPTVYAEDSFSRTVVNHWNSATTGGAYTLLSSAADYDVTGSAGTVNVPVAGNTRSAVLTTVSAQDVDLSFSVATNKLAVGGHQYVYGIARRTSATAEYRVKLRLATSGQVFVQATSLSGTTETAIGTETLVPGLTHTANGVIRVRAQFSGASPTTIRIRAWADGSPEPGTFVYTVTNSAAGVQAAGGVGLRAYLGGTTSNAPVLVTFDNFLVTSLGAPVNVAPVFSTEFTDRTDAEGAVISFDANASDANPGETLTYSATNLPNGILINSSTGVVSGTLSGMSSGSYAVVLTVSDGSLTDTDSFTWTVTEPAANVAPVFSTEFTDRTDAEGALISFDANASDANPGDTLTYSATNLPNGITINAGTGVVSGTLSATSSGSYNVVLTVSDGTLTDTDSFTWTVTEPAGPTVYAEDSFSRTVVNHWNSATTGGAYTLLSSAADYDVTGSVGTVNVPVAGNTRSAVLTSVSAQDVDLSFSVATNKLAVGGHQYVYGIARRTSATAEYRVKLRLATSGQVFVQATSLSGTTETAIGTETLVPGLTHTANGVIRVRAQFSGASPTTIRIRAWADGSPEPGTFVYTVTNSAAGVQAAGGVGLRAYLGGTTSNAPVLVTFDNFLVTSLGGPPVVPSAWPGSASVQFADAENAFAGNLSGLTYEASGTAAPGVLWAVRNGPELLYRLVWDIGAQIWVPDATGSWGAGKQLRYPGGGGQPDSEGLTITGSGPAAGVYVATERNNQAGFNGVSRASILRFDPTVAGTELLATAEWNLTTDLAADLGTTVGANTGPEAVVWIADTFLVAHGFVNETTGLAYNPATYPNHGSGLFFVGLEQNGKIYAYALNDDAGHTFTRVATIQTGFSAVMALEFDEVRNQLWAICDDTCDGRSATLQINAQGRFAVTHIYERPGAMADLNNEGVAFAANAECVANARPAFWADDANTGGHAIRMGTVICASP